LAEELAEELGASIFRAAESRLVAGQELFELEFERSS
jgi:hypothetical protein